jgi:iron complex outermembrane receptor protein
VKPNTTRSFEVGYKGLFDDRILVGVDLYYVRRKNGISELQTITPSVFAPEIANDVAAAVRETFTDAELAQFGLSVEELASSYAEAASSLSEEAIGIVEPEENFDPSTLPEVILTYINFGQLEYFGADFEVQVGLGQGTQLFANAGWLSDNFFDESELDEIGTGFVVAMNTPKYKIKAGGQHTFANGLSLGAAGRYVDEFEVRSGVHAGTVPSYFLLDLNLGMDFGQYVAGARLDITASNILDNKHREFASTPMLGRMVMGRVSYSFR